MATMTRNEFERACAEQNRAASVRVAEARRAGATCEVVPMLAFGGIPYCMTHRVMGPCPFGAEEQKGGRS